MKQFILASLALTLAACGFTPLYAGGPAGNGQVNVEMIEGRAGHALRKALLQEMAAGLPGLEGPATLTVILDDKLNRLALAPDESATRSDIVVSADYVLTVSDTAIAGKSAAETSFLVPNAPFSDITAQIDATDRATLVLARRIVDDLRIKLANGE